MTDSFEHLDAAYLMGALDPDQAAAYDVHLLECPRCRAALEEAQDVVAFLSVGDGGVFDEAPPLPATVLPHLMTAARRRTRRRWVIGVAAAAVVASALVLIVTRGSSPRDASVPMALVHPSPVSATAQVRTTEWGTQITVHCSYAAGTPMVAGYRYQLTMRDVSGHTLPLGSWQLNNGRPITFSAGTALPVDQIRSIDISDADGTPLLELTGPSLTSAG